MWDCMPVEVNNTKFNNDWHIPYKETKHVSYDQPYNIKVETYTPCRPLLNINIILYGLYFCVPI